VRVRALFPLTMRRCGDVATGLAALALLCWALAVTPSSAAWDGGPSGGDPGWDRRDRSRGSNPLGWLRYSRDSFQEVMRKLASRSARLPGPSRPGPDWLPVPPGGHDPEGPLPGERLTERRRVAESGGDRPGDRTGDRTGRRRGPRVKEWHRSSSPSCRRAGMPVEDASWYVVARGDTLWRIARVHYGNGRSWWRILHANWGISEPNLIYACQRLFIPRCRTERPPCEEPEDEPPRRICHRPQCDALVPPRPACQRPPRRPDRRIPGGCTRCGAGAHIGEWGWR
jgi:hypothetical protein